MKNYPRVGEITTVRPQGMCALCEAVLLNGQRPEKRVHIEHDTFRGNDTVHKAHGKCIKEAGNQLLSRLTMQNVANC